MTYHSVDYYVRMLEGLSDTEKKELTTKLLNTIEVKDAEEVSLTEAERQRLFDKLGGAWKDVDADELIRDIYESRTISDRDLNWD